MNSFELKGTIYYKEETQQVSDKFKKREFVIEIVNEKNSEWNDFVKFQLVNDNCSKIDNAAIGSNVTVHFNINGRKWEKDGKTSFFNTITAWKIDIEQSTQQQATSQPTQTEEDPF